MFITIYVCIDANIGQMSYNSIMSGISRTVGYSLHEDNAAFTRVHFE